MIIVTMPTEILGRVAAARSRGRKTVLTALTSAGVTTLTSTPPSLEELFLDAYRTPAR